MEFQTKPTEELVIGAEKELEFSIDSDNYLIFEILRDKMYADKIGSICREVLSNCRDANREAGSTENIKVTIIEPNTLMYVGHQSISFKDSGVGITPDRMADIYVKYASSTKRSDNSQTGGFGLGAKTPFAYNDTFTVITVCDYQGKRMKYFYSALIDATRKGKMILFDSEETTEPTGTEVIVPIKTPEDRKAFEVKSSYYTRFWGCVDYINFKNIPDSTPKVLLETEDFVLYKCYTEDSGLLIDGIPYPLASVWGFGEMRINETQSYLKFKTGELTLSANRESIQYDDATVEAIKKKSETLIKYFEDALEAKIKALPDYLEACKFYNALQSTYFSPSDTLSDMDKLIFRAKGNRYSKRLLSDYIAKTDFTFDGKYWVSSIEFRHHKVYRVSKGYSKTDYKLLNSLNINDDLSF